MINKPFAESSEQNKDHILPVLKQWFTQPGSTVLEIGSGTGQHATYFARFLDSIRWQPSDTHENLEGIEAWRNDAGLTNVLPAMQLDVTQQSWPLEITDYIFSANTVHIMSWPMVEKMFSGIRSVLKPDGIFCLYGPFNYNGQYTSPSNQQFDGWLKSRNPDSGIRDFEALCELGTKATQTAPLHLIDDIEMPQNNRILVFQQQA